MGVERLNRLKAPGLPFLTFLLRPGHWLPIRGQDETCAGVGKFDPVTGRLPYVEEERALDGMLMRSRLDVHAVLEKDIRRAQDIFALVSGIGDVM